jgi:hypothetical protein
MWRSKAQLHVCRKQWTSGVVIGTGATSQRKRVHAPPMLMLIRRANAKQGVER